MVMVYHSPISNSLLESVGLAQAATFGTPVNGTPVDMAGWDGVAALVNISTIAGAGTWQASLQMADDVGFTTNANPVIDAGTGVACASPAASTVAGLYWLEAYRPSRRFVRVIVNPLVANITYAVLMFRYKHVGLMPVSARDSLNLTNRVVVRAS